MKYIVYATRIFTEEVHYQLDAPDEAAARLAVEHNTAFIEVTRPESVKVRSRVLSSFTVDRVVEVAS